MSHLRIATATRRSERDFWDHTLLGQSLRAFPPELRPELVARFDNVGNAVAGLPALYNRWLDECPADKNLAFVHDDVFLHDPLTPVHVDQALRESDIVGLAGSRGAPPDAVSWGLGFDGKLEFNGWMRGEAYPNVLLSGAVSHVSSVAPNGGRYSPADGPPRVQLSSYGQLPCECELLDGLFLAVYPPALRRSKVCFDERFTFHLYDLDFCRSARRAGLVLTTWPILVTHASGGAFGTPGWQEAARAFRRKWSPEVETTPPSSPAPP